VAEVPIEDATSLVAVGDIAPDFELAGTGGRSYRLSSYRGAPVVLVFYPADHSPVCTAQLTHYSSDVESFAELGAQLLAVSPQDVQSHEAFASADGGFAFPLLADLDKAVGRSYGILGPLGAYRRSVFVIDGGGVVRYAHRSAAGLTYRRTPELVEAIRRAREA